MQQIFTFDNVIDIYDRDNFIVHDGNRFVFEFITSGSLFNNNIFLLSGSKGTGKTYICNIWKNIKTRQKKTVIEDIEKDEIDEYELLHKINSIVENDDLLLITSCKNGTEFNFVLPDLQSRFKNIYNIKLENLDNNEVKKQILLKLLNDKQIRLQDAIIDYIIDNIGADYETIINFVNKINEVNKITKDVIKNILQI
ncbi:MAG: hypothetical protein LBC92_00225 [Rickettsiales bacterium]|jgi:chromosomal replication initiation ATPase DnaA|nr:hypothetical protein [Rickettsiales bacterium]